MPGGVSPEGCLVLAGRTLAVNLILHHGYAVELGAAPRREKGRGKGKKQEGKTSAVCLRGKSILYISVSVQVLWGTEQGA